MSKQNLLLALLAVAGIGAAIALGVMRQNAAPAGPITIVAELPEADGALAAQVPHAVALKRQREGDGGLGPVWSQFDLDDDGKVSRKEYTPDGRWNRRFDQRDKDRDGFFTAEERRQNEARSSEGERFRRFARLSFEKYDKDADGRIDAQEFPGPPDVFQLLDEDDDGALLPVDVTEGKGQGKKSKKSKKKENRKKKQEGEAQSPDPPSEPNSQ